jgi:hypothetical protein
VGHIARIVFFGLLLPSFEEEGRAFLGLPQLGCGFKIVSCPVFAANYDIPFEDKSGW